MSIVLRLPWPSLLALALLAPATQADSQAMPTGTYLGGGRACFGKLKISARSLSWRTPFSHCSSVPYEFSNLGEKNGAAAYLFQLHAKQHECPYTSIVLLQRVAVAREATWEAIGYPSVEDQQTGRMDQALACPMVRSN